MCVCVCVRACARVCVCVCACARVHWVTLSSNIQVRLQKFEFLCTKKTKIMTFFNNSSPSCHTIVPFWRVSSERKQHMYEDTLFSFRSKYKQRIHVRYCWHRTAYVIYVCDTLQNGAIGWRGGDELLNKVIFVFFEHKKYSHSSVKLRLNPWCHLDYFNNLLATFLSIDCVRNLAVYGRVRELSDFIKNILICDLKMY